MAATDKNILITPNRGVANVQPIMTFVGNANVAMTMRVADDNSLSWENATGQLFSIANNVTSGTIFSVNDISGIPFILVNANGNISLGPYGGNVGIGTQSPSYTLDITGSQRVTGNVLMQGLTVTGSSNAASFTANINVAAASTTGAFNYGVLSYSDTNIMSQYTSNVNTYTQMILQNTSAGSGASADFVVSSNTGNSASYYGNFGINSSTFAGAGALNLPNATYLYSNGGDLALGTGTANNIRFVINNGATDALTIFTTNTTIYSNLVVSAAVTTISSANTTLSGTTTTVSGNLVMSGTTTGLVSTSNINVFGNLTIPSSGTGLFFSDGTFMSTAASGTGSGLTLGQTLSLQQNLAMP